MVEQRAALILELAKQWHPTKNGGLKISEAITSTSAWWILEECGHEWEAVLGSRVKGSSCPYCANKKVLAGFNDLATIHPMVAAEWHPTKNGSLLSSMVISGSHKKAWWLGKECGHEWESSITSRTGKNPVGCPICSGKQVLAGFNDLMTLFPNVAQLWHPTLNGNLTPRQIIARTRKKIWWLCEKGHAFEASPSDRVRASHPCPVCINKVCLSGVNDAATLYPHLMEEWDEEKNEGLSLQTLVVGSPKKVWWKCPLGHSWMTEIRARTERQTGCIYCSGQKSLKGFNDLESQLPHIASEWHPIKNGDLTPDMVHSGAAKIVWWQCQKLHEWKGAIFDRKIRNSGCPYCSGRNSILGVTDLATTHPDLAAQWHPTKNGELLATQISAGSGSKKIWWIGDCGHEWNTYAYNRKAGKNCPKCSSNTSKAELEIYEYVTNLLPNTVVKHGDKKLLGGKELDIYIPEMKIAVEYNGIYWHSEKTGTPKNYHYDKWLDCKNKGIQLIQIWEDEWNRNSELIRRMLAYKLGVTDQKKVFARKTRVVEFQSSQAELFMIENHIQGFASGSHYIGLVEKDDDNDTPIAILILKNEAGTEGKTLNIIRYATSYNVVGGFTKLISYATKTYKPESYLTFADNCISDGGLYLNNGFVADKELAPDYMYVVNHERRHKFGYRLKRFKTDPNLLWEEGLTERELANLNHLSRIWDAGKIRYILTTRIDMKETGR